MANRRISVPRFPATPTEPAVNINIIENGDGTVSLYVDDGLAVYSAPITATGQPVSIPGGGAISGSGTTGTIPLWTNGPGGVIGDSLLVQSDANTFSTPDFGGVVFKNTNHRFGALSGQVFLDSGAWPTEYSSNIVGFYSITLSGIPNTFHVDQLTNLFVSYNGTANPAGAHVESLTGVSLHNWTKSLETIDETIGLFIDDSFSSFSPGNTFVIKSTSTAPSSFAGQITAPVLIGFKDNATSARVSGPQAPSEGGGTVQSYSGIFYDDAYLNIGTLKTRFIVGANLEMDLEIQGPHQVQIIAVDDSQPDGQLWLASKTNIVFDLRADTETPSPQQLVVDRLSTASTGAANTSGVGVSVGPVSVEMDGVAETLVLKAVNGVSTPDDLILSVAGKGLKVKEGVNATLGTGTLNGATEVTIATTKVTDISRIFLTVQTPGGVPTGALYVSSRIAGTSFGVKGTAGDTSDFAWDIVEPS